MDAGDLRRLSGVICTTAPCRAQSGGYSQIHEEDIPLTQEQFIGLLRQANFDFGKYRLTLDQLVLLIGAACTTMNWDMNEVAHKVLTP